MDWNICSVMRGMIPLSSSESISAPCRRELDRLDNLCIRSHHHRESFPASCLTVGENSAIVTVKDILRAEMIDRSDSQRQASLMRLSRIPLTILIKCRNGIDQEISSTSLTECLLLHPVVKNFVLLRSHRKHSIKGESILLRTLANLCRSDMGCLQILVKGDHDISAFTLFK